LKLEDKIKIFEKNLSKCLEVDKYNDTEDELYDYFFLSYEKNDTLFNKKRFSFLENLKSEKEIIRVIDGIISAVIKHEHHDSSENIIESYINSGFIFLDDKEYSSEEFIEFSKSNKNILHCINDK